LLKYKIPFDNNLFVEQTKLTLPYVYSDVFSRMKDSRLVAIILFSTGFIILIAGSELSTLFFAIGVFAIYSTYLRHENYVSLKNDHLRILRKFAETNKSITFGIFEFRDDCLRVSNDFSCTWISWIEIKKYKISNQNLLLIPKNNKYEIFVLSEYEVGKEEFEQILDFIKKRIN